MILSCNRINLLRDFLTPITMVVRNNPVEVFLSKDKIEVICNDPSSKNTCFLYASMDIKLDTEDEQMFNPILGDIKQFMDYVSVITSDTVELILTNNSFKYVSKNVRFNYHLKDEQVLKQKRLLTPYAIDNFKIILNCVVKSEDLNTLSRMSTSTKNADKIYFYSKDSELFCDLTNKTIPYSDCFNLQLCETCRGTIKNDIAIPVSSLWTVVNCLSSRYPTCIFKITDNNCIIFEITTDSNTIKIIIPALLK